MSKLYIVVENGELKPYQSLDEVIAGIGSFAEFVAKQPEVVCLDRKNQKDWAIESVSLTEIAKAVVERES